MSMRTPRQGPAYLPRVDWRAASQSKISYLPWMEILQVFRPPTHLDDSFGHFPKKSTPHVETRYLSLGSRNTDIEMQDARCNTYMNKTQTTRVKWGEMVRLFTASSRAAQFSASLRDQKGTDTASPSNELRSYWQGIQALLALFPSLAIWKTPMIGRVIPGRMKGRGRGSE